MLENFVMKSLFIQSRFSLLLLSLLFSFFLSACDNFGDKAAEDVEILTLTDENIQLFSQTLVQDYSAIHSTLLTQFDRFRSANDSFGFAQYRNYNWTPMYIEKKDYYWAVFKKNRSYIESSNLTSFFLGFENLIYLGINLKNGLLDEDQSLIDDTLEEAKHDQQTLTALLKTL